MDSDKSAVRNVAESIFHGMETGEATFDHPLGTGKPFLGTILPPPAYMGLWKHSDDVYPGDCFEESFNCQAQDGFSLKQEELLGDIGSHADTGTACGND